MTKMIGTIGLTRMNNWMSKMSGMDRSHLMKDPEKIILFKGGKCGIWKIELWKNPKQNVVVLYYKNDKTDT